MREHARIADVTVTPLLIEDGPLLNMHGVHQPLTPRAVITLDTDAGVRGLGETYGDGALIDILTAAAAVLRGRALFALPESRTRLAALVRERWPQIVADAPPSERSGKGIDEVIATVVSAFDVAITDAQARVLDVPVHELLGGAHRDRVPFAGYLFYRWDRHPDPTAAIDGWGEALTPADIVRQAAAMRERFGFDTFKLKGGVFPPAEEIAALRALRDAFPDAALRIDPNGAWSPDTARELAPHLVGLVDYLEDPCLDLDALAAIHRDTGVPIASNMMVATTADILPAAVRDAVQVLLVDHHYWGGLRSGQHAAATARAIGWQVGFHSNSHVGISLAAMVHLAASVPGPIRASDTHTPWQDEDVVRDPLRFVDGAVLVPDSPGLGVELDEHALAIAHARWLESDVRVRDDIAAMRVADPHFTPRTMPRW